MTVSVTTRLGLTRWSADQDPLARAQFDSSHAALEQQAAKFTSGTTLPTPSASHARSLFYKTDTQVLYYFNGTDNTGSWVIVNNFGGTTQGLTFGGSSSAGLSQFAARADHVHAVPDPQLSSYIQRAIVDAKGDLIVGSANDTVTRLPAGANGQILAANSVASTGLQWVAPSSTLIVQNTMPSSAVQGDIWFDTTTGRMYVYYDNFFVEVGTASDYAADVVDAKGDLIVGTANDTITRLPVGNRGEVLEADPDASTGVKWAEPSTGFDKIFLMMGA